MDSSGSSQPVLMGVAVALLLVGGGAAFFFLAEKQPAPPPASGAQAERLAAEQAEAQVDQAGQAAPRAGEKIPLDVAAGRAATPWSANAVKYRGQNGQQFEFMCPAGGRVQSVWGDHPYTDDSSICAAAVHAGLISARHGGHVLVEIQPGEKAYQGNHRNGVKSNSYAAWSGSFVFPQAPLHLPGMPVPPPPPEETTWSTNALKLRDQGGQRFVIDCPPGGSPGSLWGSNPYTDDSSVCTAGAHAGVIGLAAGGPVEIEIGPGQKGYRGCRQNGIQAHNWGRYDGSFRIVGAKSGCSQVAEKAGGVALDWQSRATELFGQPGDRFEVFCPKNGVAYIVWGANPYTDDSSVCTAAVHAGRIDLDRGGSVQVRILGGQKAYQGSLQHGIKTGGWGKWGGSFAIE